jgi:small nuclear ribonucleoprotein (snRNP)-like protein
MFKRSTQLGALAPVLMVFLLVTLLMPLTTAGAASNVVPVEGVGYNVDASMADNLKALLGKQVYVTLESGNTFTGFVKVVGNHLLHLEKLAGKDYFDALIRIDSINAIDTRFREVKR